MVQQDEQTETQTSEQQLEKANQNLKKDDDEEDGEISEDEIDVKNNLNIKDNQTTNSNSNKSYIEPLSIDSSGTSPAADLLLIQSQIVDAPDFMASSNSKLDFPVISKPVAVIDTDSSNSDSDSESCNDESSDNNEAKPSDFEFSEADDDENTPEDGNHGNANFSGLNTVTKTGGGKIKRKIQIGKINDEDEDDDGDDVFGAVGPKGFKTKHELDPPPIEKLDIVIPPNANLIAIGQIFALVQDNLVIESTPNPHQTLDEDTIVCTRDRKVIGKIFETFGPVVQPLYSVRYVPDEDGPEVDRIKAGDTVFFVEEMAKYVFAAQLRSLKGTDASNIYDEEIVNDDDLEFSDDEKEAEYKIKKKAELKKRRKLSGNAKDEEDQTIDSEIRKNNQTHHSSRNGASNARAASGSYHRESSSNAWTKGKFLESKNSTENGSNNGETSRPNYQSSRESNHKYQQRPAEYSQSSHRQWNTMQYSGANQHLPAQNSKPVPVKHSLPPKPKLNQLLAPSVPQFENPPKMPFNYTPFPQTVSQQSNAARPPSFAPSPLFASPPSFNPFPTLLSTSQKPIPYHFTPGFPPPRPINTLQHPQPLQQPPQTPEQLLAIMQQQQLELQRQHERQLQLAKQMLQQGNVGGAEGFNSAVFMAAFGSAVRPPADSNATSDSSSMFPQFDFMQEPSNK